PPAPPPLSHHHVQLGARDEAFCTRSRLVGTQRRGGGGAAVPQELRAALRLAVLADRRGGGAQHVQGAEEAAVGLVLPRHRAVALPARPPQLVQAAVVAGPRIRVRGDRVALGVSPFGQRGPGRGVGREPGRDLLRRLARGHRGVRLGVRKQVGGGRLAQQVPVFHIISYLCYF